MRAGVADAFGAAGYDGDFAGLGGDLRERELVGSGFLGAAAEVFGDGVLGVLALNGRRRSKGEGRGKR